MSPFGQMLELVMFTLYTIFYVALLIVFAITLPWLFAGMIASLILVLGFLTRGNY